MTCPALPTPDSVLVVGDALREIPRILGRLGYTVLFAETEDQAVHLILQAPPGVILTNYTLAHGTGLDLAGLLGANPKTRDIPVLLNTGYHEYADPARLVGTNIRQAILKPTSLPVLVQALNSQLGPLAPPWPENLPGPGAP